MTYGGWNGSKVRNSHRAQPSRMSVPITTTATTASDDCLIRVRRVVPSS